MNTSTTLLAALLIASGSAFAQQADSAATGRTPAKQGTQAMQKKQQRNQVQELKGFVDKNANGIDDRLEIGSKTPRGKGKDKFIDKDGDGICDERATGMGFRRNNAIGPAGEQAGAMERKRKRGGG